MNSFIPPVSIFSETQEMPTPVDPDEEAKIRMAIEYMNMDSRVAPTEDDIVSKINNNIKIIHSVIGNTHEFDTPNGVSVKYSNGKFDEFSHIRKIIVTDHNYFFVFDGGAFCLAMPSSRIEWVNKMDQKE